MRSVQRRATAATPDGSSTPNGTMIPITSSAPPFRCRSVAQWRMHFDGRECQLFVRPTRDERALSVSAKPGVSRNVGGIDVVLIFLGLVTLETLLGGIGYLRLLGISLGPELKAPATGRCIFLGILDHCGHALARALDIRAIGDGEIVKVGAELAAVGLGAALLERGRGARIGVHVVHAAERLEQRARLVDDH